MEIKSSNQIGLLVYLFQESYGQVDLEVSQKLESQIKFQIGEKYGFDDHNVRLMIQKPINIEIIKNIDNKSRLDSLVDLVRLILADGVIDAKEITYCQMSAFKLGFKPYIVQYIVDRIKLSKDDLYREALHAGVL